MLKIIFSMGIITLLHIDIVYSMEKNRTPKLSILLENKNDLYSAMEQADKFILPHPLFICAEHPVDTAQTNNELKKKGRLVHKRQILAQKKVKKQPIMNITFHAP